MDRDLFLAILAMDAYNRGYEAGVGGLPTTGSIGNALPLPDSAVLGSTPSGRIDENAGFYAIAYDVSNVAGFGTAGKVIS
jgi:hypothetical protein